jgi:hypothetical protein
MRHFTAATAVALAVASMFAMSPAKADMGGPLVNEQGQCRQFGPNNTNLTYSYFGPCPSSVQGPHGHVHAIRATTHHRRIHS